MGTRADFYVGTDAATMEWLGSIAWDGYEIGEDIPGAANEAEYRGRVAKFLAERDDATLPDMGWPWPWDDSTITDCAYTWDRGRVLSAHGSPERWLAYPAAYDEEADEWEGLNDAPFAFFPNMSSRKAVTLGSRSGLIVLKARP